MVGFLRVLAYACALLSIAAASADAAGARRPEAQFVGAVEISGFHFGYSSPVTLVVESQSPFRARVLTPPVDQVGDAGKVYLEIAPVGVAEWFVITQGQANDHELSFSMPTEYWPEGAAVKLERTDDGYRSTLIFEPQTLAGRSVVGQILLKPSP